MMTPRFKELCLEALGLLQEAQSERPGLFASIYLLEAVDNIQRIPCLELAPQADPEPSGMSFEDMELD